MLLSWAGRWLRGVGTWYCGCPFINVLLYGLRCTLGTVALLALTEGLDGRGWPVAHMTFSVRLRFAVRHVRVVG